MSPEPSLDIRLWSGFTRRVLAVLLGTGLLVGGSLTAVSIWSLNAEGEAFLRLRGWSLARSLARAAFVPMVLEDTAALNGLTAGFKDEMNVAYTAVYTPKGAALSKSPAEVYFPLDTYPPDILARRIPFPGGKKVLDVILPLRYEGAPAKGELLGYARVCLTEDRVREEVAKAIKKNIIICLGLMTIAFSMGGTLLQGMTRQMRRFLEDVQASAELKRTNKELEAFSYSVSHDLRTPLRAIDGFSHTLVEEYSDKLDEQGKSYLARVRRGCARMGQIIDDLLALSRVVRQEMRRQDVDLGALAKAVAEQLTQAEPGRRMAFIAPEHVLVRGDAGLLRIVMENLLGNAWKFTRKTEDARVEFGVRAERGDRVFYVRDNGAGFDMAYVDKLFGAFQRLHETSDFPGTGVGLATVQRVIQRHGGRIWAEGAVGRGATFHFTLKGES